MPPPERTRLADAVTEAQEAGRAHERVVAREILLGLAAGDAVAALVGTGAVGTVSCRGRPTAIGRSTLSRGTSRYTGSEYSRQTSMA